MCAIVLAVASFKRAVVYTAHDAHGIGLLLINVEFRRVQLPAVCADNIRAIGTVPIKLCGQTDDKVLTTMFTGLHVTLPDPFVPFILLSIKPGASTLPAIKMGG